MAGAGVGAGDPDLARRSRHASILDLCLAENNLGGSSALTRAPVEPITFAPSVGAQTMSIRARYEFQTPSPSEPPKAENDLGEGRGEGRGEGS